MRSGKDFTFKDKKDLKILLINPFGIGDVLFSTPLIGILKKNLPYSSLYYICNKRTFEVIERSPQLDGIFIFEKGDYKEIWRKDKLSCLKELISFINKIRKENFDLAIDMSMGHQYSFFLKLISVPERIGFDYKGRGRFLTKKLEFNGFNDKPIGEYYKDLLRLIGLNVSDESTTIYLTGEDRDYIEDFFKKERIGKEDTVIGIAPGGGVSFGQDNLAFKRWPKDKFAKLGDSLIKDMDSKVILLWGPGEEILIKEIADLMETKPIIGPKTTVRQLAALMSRLSCVICNDAGPLHVAVAIGARTISIFGPSDPNVYGPYPKDKQHLYIKKDIECSPCYKKFKIPNCKTLRCLNELDYKEVLKLVKLHVNHGKAKV